MKYKVNIEVEGDETLKGIKIDFIGQKSRVTYLPMEEDSKESKESPNRTKLSKGGKSSSINEKKEKKEKVEEPAPIPPEMNDTF
jgi:hypothetical protein